MMKKVAIKFANPIRAVTLIALTVALALAFDGVSGAQDLMVAQTTTPTEVPPEPENITIGLSSETVQIATNFAGTDLTIFGAVNNARSDAPSTGGYDVIVVLEGPARPIIVREKKSVLGMWINADALEFADVPRSYVLASTRSLGDVARDEAFQQLSLGVAQRTFQPADEATPIFRREYFSTALRNEKLGEGLYSEGVGNVRFLSQSLFKATLFLPPDVPLGTHRARAFLFRNGTFLDEDSTGLYVAKDSFEQWLFTQSQVNGFLYGLVSVLAAILIGWSGRILFRKD
jgi:uncharacterized protein (TIGR02186 family)